MKCAYLVCRAPCSRCLHWRNSGSGSDQGFVLFAAILLKFACKFVLLVILVVEDETAEPFLATFSRAVLQKAFLKTVSGYLHSFSKCLTILSRGQD